MARIRPHQYSPDLAVPVDHRRQRPCTCGLPQGNAAHEPPDSNAAQSEHRRRIGDRP